MKKLFRKEKTLCKLCLQAKPLRNSHIIPEWMYGPLYDSKHRAISVASDPGEREQYIQKGIREKLLCQECETKLSLYESHAASVARDIKAAKPDPSRTFIEVKGVDYTKFKLFELSLLWRASVSSHKMFAAVKLDEDEEMLRQLIFEGAPGEPDEYGCMILTFLNTKNLRRIFWSPLNDELNGEWCIRFATGSLHWYFFPHSAVSPSIWRSTFINKSGNLAVFISPWSEQEMLSSMRDALQKAGKIPK